jgi:hypothetical protein
MGRKPQGFLSHFSRYALHLVKDLTGTDDGFPSLRRPFALAHPDFSRFFGKRFVGENPNPDSPPPFDVTGHGNSGGFDLFGADFTALNGHQPEFAEIQAATATGNTPHFAFLLFAKFYFFGAKHNTTPVAYWKSVCRINKSAGLS